MNKKSEECLSCINLQKRLKVLQADYDFQIKKFNEDRSTQRALFQLNMNKQMKKLMDKYQREKQQRAKENDNWIKKYDELMQKQKLEMIQFEKKCDKKIQTYEQQKNVQLSQFKQQIVKHLEITIISLKTQKQSEKIQLTGNHQKQICQLKVTQQQKINKIIHKYDEQLKKKCSQYQTIMVGITSEKTVEENLHKRTKQESKTIQAKYLQQIYGLKRTIHDYEEKIESLQVEITLKCDNIDQLKVQIDRKQQNYQNSYKQLALQFDNRYEAEKLRMETKVQQLFKKELDNCAKYEKALEKIQEHRDMENQMYKANMNDVKSCVEDRPSRLEDIQEIFKLREKLLRKEKHCESLTEQLRWYRLELENKEDTYNKIFGPDSKNNQSIYIKRKDIKLKRAGKSVTTVRQILGAVNNTSYLGPLVGNLEKKLLPPKQNKIL